MTIAEVVADTLVRLSYVLAFAYVCHRWIGYLTERLKYVGADPVPGIPIGAKMDGRE